MARRGGACCKVLIQTSLMWADLFLLISRNVISDFCVWISEFSHNVSHGKETKTKRGREGMRWVSRIGCACFQVLLPCNTTLPHAPRQRIFLDKYFPNIMHGYLNFHAGEPEEVVRAVRCCFNPLGPWAESLIYLLSGEREREGGLLESADRSREQRLL